MVGLCVPYLQVRVDPQMGSPAVHLGLLVYTHSFWLLAVPWSPQGEGPGHSGRSGVGIIQVHPRIARGYTVTPLQTSTTMRRST